MLGEGEGQVEILTQGYLIRGAGEEEGLKILTQGYLIRGGVGRGLGERGGEAKILLGGRGCV